MRGNELKPSCPPPEKENIASPNNINISYAYLPNGDRIMRQNAISTIYYLYDREDRIADYDQSGNLLIAYTHGPEIDEPVAMTMNNSTYFYIPDIQGSIRAIISADNGSLMASYVYDVWGNLVSHGGAMAEKNDYLYTGREYDWQTGIYYYRARYYNPEIGRFLQSSWEHTKEMNMYVYVGNDPVNNEDPSGHPGYTPPYLPDHGGGGGPGTLVSAQTAEFMKWYRGCMSSCFWVTSSSYKEHVAYCGCDAWLKTGHSGCKLGYPACNGAHTALYYRRRMII